MPIDTESSIDLDAKTPFAELTSRIGWRVRFSEIVFDEPPYLVMQSVPELPGCAGDLDEKGIVWNVFALIDSIKRPGAYQLFTCECGYAPDADLNDRVMVSFPDATSIIWELDISGLRPVLDFSFEGVTDGFVRHVFSREEYEVDICDMIEEMQNCGKTPLTIITTPDKYGLKDLLDAYDVALDVPIALGMLEPSLHGDDLERLYELDTHFTGEREPLWSTGTLVEFGFFVRHDGHDLMKVDGEFISDSWPEKYFTRWIALDAFREWLSFTHRAWGLSAHYVAPPLAGKNEFVLLRETDRVLCHEAGMRLAAIVQFCLDEGSTAPDVTVRYTSCFLHCTEIQE